MERDGDGEGETFWELADEFVQALDFDSAELVYREALKHHANDPDIMDALGDVLLQKGDVENATKIFKVSIEMSPDIGADKYLNMAQLSEGKESLAYYSKGLEIMRAEKEDLMDEEEVMEDIHAKMCAALVAMAEIYLTDECFADNAEINCEKYIIEALSIDETNIEALQTLASCRISQQRAEEALEALRKSYDSWKSIEVLDVNQLPSYNFRFQTAKLFLELEGFEEAADVLASMVDEDDTNAEVLYLLGFALNKLQHGDALECLQQCKDLLAKQKITDEIILKKVNEQYTIAESLPAVEDDGNEDEDSDDGMDTV